MKRYEYDSVLYEMPDNGGAYMTFPWDIRQEFGKGRVKVHAEFDCIPYDGNIVNMGVKNPDGSACYIIGVLKTIRNKLKKHNVNMLLVIIEERETGEQPKKACSGYCTVLTYSGYRLDKNKIL